MKKKIVIGISILVIIIISIGSYKCLSNNPEVISTKVKEQINNINMLTMMLETEAGTGIYEETKASEWPQEGYTFNETLSKCENGGTLKWDDNNKKVVVESNTSNKCYVYFDKKDEIFLLSVESINNGSQEITLYINDVQINVGESIEYKIGDELKYKIDSFFDCDLYIYNLNNEILFSITDERCLIDVYIFTGYETRIVLKTPLTPSAMVPCQF